MRLTHQAPRALNAVRVVKAVVKRLTLALLAVVPLALVPLILVLLIHAQVVNSGSILPQGIEAMVSCLA